MVHYDWQYREGRDHEGEKFCVHLLIHGSGQIVARIYGPCAPDEFSHRAWFYCKFPDNTPVNVDTSVDFIDLDSAKHYIERMFTKYDPFDELLVKTKNPTIDMIEVTEPIPH
jgi:hypothetical protein